MVKRFFDTLCSIAGMTVLLPLLIVLAFWIKKESPGSVFYRQPRIGLDGKIFDILKFRSMVINADQIGGYSTQPGDARITKTGLWLRKTSLDELPQIINVLRGDMSLVGPRPSVPAQRENYTQLQWDKRNSVRPGITGLAQATLRSAATPEERIALDLAYVDQQSFYFDIKILLMTVKQVLSKGGAW